MLPLLVGEPNHGSQDCGWTHLSYILVDARCFEQYEILCETPGGEQGRIQNFS